MVVTQHLHSDLYHHILKYMWWGIQPLDPQRIKLHSSSSNIVHRVFAQLKLVYWYYLSQNKSSQFARICSLVLTSSPIQWYLTSMSLVLAWYIEFLLMAIALTVLIDDILIQIRAKFIEETVWGTSFPC